MREKTGKRIPASQPVTTAILVLLAVFALFPALFMFLNSFMGKQEVVQSYGAVFDGSGDAVQFHLIPREATLEGYAQVFLLSPEYLEKFWSSMLLAVSVVAGQTAVSCFAGYGFAKFRFPLKNAAFYLIIILMMMPVQVVMVSQYPVLNALGLLGSYSAIILPGAFGAFGIFLITQVFSYVPDEIIEAAKLDGANHFQILFGVVIPYSKTGIASLIILSFIDNWNLVEQPIVFLKNRYQYPLSVFLASINTEQLDLAFVCGVMAIVPSVIIYLFLKDALIEGIRNTNIL